jgi:hypothetical protein
MALLALSVVTKVPAVAPPVEYKLTQEDRRFLHRLLKEFLFDPTGAQWVTVQLIPGNRERMGWWTAVNANRTAKVFLADGESTSVPLQFISPIDFITSCKEFLQPTGKRLKAEPIDLIEKPGQDFFIRRAGVDASSLVLAAWLYRLGQEPLAAKVLARVSDRRRVLTELRRYLAWSAYSKLLYAYTMRTDEEALAHGERLLRLYSNEAAEWHRQGSDIVDDLQRRKRQGTFGGKLAKLPENFDRWEVKKKIIYLIDALEDVDEPRWRGDGGMALEFDSRIAALIAIGEPAVPALIGVIEKDKRLTRRLRFTEGPLRPQSVLSVREAALVAVESILRRQLPFHDSQRAEFMTRHEEGARQVASELRAYMRKPGRLPFDERMMKVLTDPKAGSKAWREAALELALLGKQRGSVETMRSGAISRRESDVKRRNRAIAKFHKPTVAEAILAALDRELKAHDAREREDCGRDEIEEAYLRALHELNDTRVAAEAARRSRNPRGRMRYEWAYLSHCLLEPGPLAEFAKEFERGKVKLLDGRAGKNELHRIVLYFVAVATKESDRALHALADRKHPAHHLARAAILADRQRPSSQSEEGVWFRHPYCLTILRQALEDTTPTGVIWKVDATMRKSGRRTQEQVRDVAAWKLWELVFGIESYDPLVGDSNKSLGEIKSVLDRFKGRLQRASRAEEDLLDIPSIYITYIPDIPPLDRPATPEDVKAGRAVFHLGGKGKRAAQQFPASGALEDRRAMIVQAETSPDGTLTYGVVSHSGLRAVPAAKLSNIRTVPK